MAPSNDIGETAVDIGDELDYRRILAVGIRAWRRYQADGARYVAERGIKATKHRETAGALLRRDREQHDEEHEKDHEQADIGRDRATAARRGGRAW